MDSKREFNKTIFAFYLEIAQDTVPRELVKQLSDKIADYYYEQYSRFTIQYPKSIKRYSTFQLKDLDHPYTHEIIIKFFKDKLGNSYSDYAKIVLGVTDAELKAFEKNREEFYKMF